MTSEFLNLKKTPNCECSNLPGVNTFGIWFGELGGIELLDELFDDNGPFFISIWLLLLLLFILLLLLLFVLMELLFIIERPFDNATLWWWTMLFAMPKPEVIWLWWSSWLDGSAEIAETYKITQCLKYTNIFVTSGSMFSFFWLLPHEAIFKAFLLYKMKINSMKK